MRAATRSAQATVWCTIAPQGLISVSRTKEGSSISAHSLIEELRSRRAGENIDISPIRGRIHDEFDSATNSEERSMLLGVFAVTMDHAEKHITGHDLESFKTARQQDYNLLKECLVGEDVCAETMFSVTARELAAGRMEESHTLRRLAVNAMAAPHRSRAALVAAFAKKSAAPAKARTLSKLRGFLGHKRYSARHGVPG